MLTSTARVARSALAAATLVAALPSIARAGDVMVYLKNGGKVRGTLAEGKPDEVTLKVAGGGVVRFPKRDVTLVEPVQPNPNEKPATKPTPKPSAAPPAPKVEGLEAARKAVERAVALEDEFERTRAIEALGRDVPHALLLALAADPETTPAAGDVANGLLLASPDATRPLVVACIAKLPDEAAQHARSLEKLLVAIGDDPNGSLETAVLARTLALLRSAGGAGIFVEPLGKIGTQRSFVPLATFILDAFSKPQDGMSTRFVQRVAPLVEAVARKQENPDAALGPLIEGARRLKPGDLLADMIRLKLLLQALGASTTAALPLVDGLVTSVETELSRAQPANPVALLREARIAASRSLAAIGTREAAGYLLRYFDGAQGDEDYRISLAEALGGLSRDGGADWNIRLELAERLKVCLDGGQPKAARALGGALTRLTGASHGLNAELWRAWLRQKRAEAESPPR